MRDPETSWCVCVLLMKQHIHMESRGHVTGLNCRVTSRDMFSNKTFSGSKPGSFGGEGFVCVCVFRGTWGEVERKVVSVQHLNKASGGSP